MMSHKVYCCIIYDIICDMISYVISYMISYVISYMISPSSRPDGSFPRSDGLEDRRDSNVLLVCHCRAHSPTQCNKRFEADQHFRWMGPNCATRWCSVHLQSISGHAWEVCQAPDHSHLQSMLQALMEASE